MGVIYQTRFVIDKNGKVKKKKFRISAQFEIKKKKPKLAPITKEKILLLKIQQQKKKLDLAEAKKKQRRKHERYLLKLEKDKSKHAYECWCGVCKKNRIIKEHEYVIIKQQHSKALAVSGKCIVCGRKTIMKILKKATEEEIREFETGVNKGG